MKLPKYLDFLNSKEDNSIEGICKKYKITNYKINSDGSIDVNGDVILKHPTRDDFSDVNRPDGRKFFQESDKLTKLPLKFNYVSGNFDCSFNRLTTLEGSPNRVDGNFDCDDNKLNSLEFCPEYVGKFFLFNGNNISSVEFYPKYIGDIPYYRGNPIHEILWKFPQNTEVVEYLNDYDVIQDDVIVIDRLESLIDDLNLKCKIDDFKYLKYYTLE